MLSILTDEQSLGKIPEQTKKPKFAIAKAPYENVSKVP